MPDISVNLATHNRAPFLEACLVSLCEQSLSPDRYEICVVANACTDHTPQVVDKIAAQYPRHNLFMVSEPTLGLSRARNLGLQKTQAPLVANIDDDGTVASDWLECFIQRFDSLGPDVAAVTGEVEPVWSMPRPAWLTDKMLEPLSAHTALGPVARFLNDDEWVMEGNTCYRREALAQVGGYPLSLGRVGGNLLSGEGSVEQRIRQNGGKFFFDPHLVLRHYIHPDRLTPLWFRQRYFWQGVSSVAVRHYQKRHNLPVADEAFINLPLNPEDWRFVAGDTADNLHENLSQFQSLGFALALSGIIPLEKP